MSLFSDYIKAVDVVDKELVKEIKPIRERYKIIKDNTIYDFIKQNMGWNIGDMLFFSCRGSGYYGKYQGIEDGDIILEVHSKGGINKNKTIEIYSGSFDRIEKVIKK